MARRSGKPAEIAPDFRCLQADLIDARPTVAQRQDDPQGTERRRVKAVARLRALARDCDRLVPFHRDYDGLTDPLREAGWG